MRHSLRGSRALGRREVDQDGEPFIMIEGAIRPTHICFHSIFIRKKGKLFSDRLLLRMKFLNYVLVEDI